ncbi:endo-1,4-beta-xylanase Z [Colletotrichum spaethianum]|uniref:Endo-1,4-beta-xylanase Z n=1 Tax=Colletotrichum spaethianum TaxID=700344 RepID=A0AA37PAQ2_9PEZI|nr:endo-1,4-beta-xylanase Z [Colletotrichum spaethianum]GKT48759.1 endo-1,4-beta-xylanase Z [Colletotrichum spaethianum]
MSKSLFSSLLAAFAVLQASASVTIRKTGRGPTGYEVDFKYTNTTASRVLIGGGIQPFTDQFHTTLETNGMYDPHTYQPGDFYVKSRPAVNFEWPYEMTVDKKGVWSYTTPLPSGVYSFAYLVDCDYVLNCTVDTGKLVLDPDLPPFQNVQGDQVSSTFQVPFDAEFQTGDPCGNFDYALPAAPEHRGTIFTVNYTSPGSIHPAPDVHDFTIYLPAEYGRLQDKKYPLLYISHGANGNGAEWENLGRVSSILDNLIAEGHIAPTVAVMPSFYNLDDTLPRFVYGNSQIVPAPYPHHVRENYQRYLFPWVEEHFDVCREPSCRAFSGLSLGGLLTYEMLVNATDYFEYYGFFSPATIAPYYDAPSMAENLSLVKKGVFVACGLYDTLLTAALDLQHAFNEMGMNSISRISPFGSHYWNTWQDNLWWFGIKALWQPIPFTVESGRIKPSTTAPNHTLCLH